MMVVALFAFAIESMAQSPSKVTVPLNASFQKPLPDEQPMYVLELVQGSDGTYQGSIFTKENVRMIGKGQYAKFGDRYLENGHFTFYYNMGNKESEGKYEKGARVGYWKRFNPDGSEKTQRFYNPEGAAMLRKVLGYDKL